METSRIPRYVQLHPFVQAFSASVTMPLIHPLFESRDFTHTPLTLQCVSFRDEDTRLRTTLFYPVQSFTRYHNSLGNDPKTDPAAVMSFLTDSWQAMHNLCVNVRTLM